MDSPPSISRALVPLAPSSQAQSLAQSRARLSDPVEPITPGSRSGPQNSEPSAPDDRSRATARSRSSQPQSRADIDDARQELARTLAQFGREALGRPSPRPAFERLGQFIDIRV
ncbi:MULTISPECIES: hypothetical protein [unclassified Iodidimonas]|uniref:hypothetical protein n=1 Tax=unclassified Iodidimonas TaxID=2626145 RepID=UPI002482CFDA|nr:MULTISPECIES: hypothetical protein [unclassified Iodidimonas]